MRVPRVIVLVFRGGPAVQPDSATGTGFPRIEQTATACDVKSSRYDRRGCGAVVEIRWLHEMVSSKLSDD